MIDKPDNIDSILPFGEAIRVFLHQPFLTKADLKACLRSRGVFVFSPEKAETIPLLSAMLLTPSEFDALREKQRFREDIPKSKTRYLPWRSAKPLLECIPENFSIAALLDDNCGNFKLIGDPTFVPVDPKGDHLRLDLEIERHDFSKSWCQSHNRFKASVELKKVVSGDTVNLVLVHTAPETQSLTQHIAKHLTDHFTDQKAISSDDPIETIDFSAFTNAKRVLFFLRLAHDFPSGIEFKEITDFHISPDAEGPLPDDLKLLEKGVKQLKLIGKNLQENLFVKNVSLHDRILVSLMEARYCFQWSGITGCCVAKFEFSGFNPEEQIGGELLIEINNLIFDKPNQHLNKPQQIEKIQRRLEEGAYEIFKELRTRSTKLDAAGIEVEGPSPVKQLSS